MLRWLAEMRFLSLPQIARLCCPAARPDLSQRSARRRMREMFDAGLVDVLPVSRAALAPPGVGNDASLLYGSAPNVYAPASEGLKLLRRMGLVGEGGPEKDRKRPAYGPRNGLFLAHELQVRDVRVWLETAARAGGHTVECWRDGEEAVIPLGRDRPAVTGRERPPVTARPDAWFALRLDVGVLVGLAEVDRGTERGDRRWGEKLEAYAALFADRQALAAATGYVNARVLVLVPTPARRDGLAAFLAERTRESGLPPDLADRFWLAVHDALERPDLTEASWRRPGREGLWPLVAPPTPGPTPPR